MGGVKRLGVRRLGGRRWLSAARHPARRDFVIAMALLVVPWVLLWALAPRHHLDATAVAILVAVTIGLATLWLTYAGVRNALKTGPTDSGTGSAVITAGPVGPVVYQPRRGVTGKPVRLADPPSLLAGREDLLAELHRRLAGGGVSGPRTVVLSGLGGVGKTSAALAYAHHHLAEVGVAWQFAAQDPAVLEAEYAELAAQLGARDSADNRDPVASVHGTLAAFAQQWLLIFDNAPDRATVERFLPPAGPGQVLVTSRDPNWPPGQLLAVPVLDTEAAAGFLTDRTGDQDKQAASELAAELGGLPLALEQAGAYIQASGDSMTGYLASFVQRRPELLRRGEPTGYPQTVATTWRLAFEDLQQAAPGAVGLLRLLAFCAPEAIPLRLLLQPRPDLASSSANRWRRCWRPCWRIAWRPVTRSGRCAGIRWSARLPTGRCRYTGWSRPSPPIRCQPSWRRRGSRQPPPWSRPRSPPTPTCLRPGRYAHNCFRTRRRRWPRTAMGWPGLLPT